jgi:hypothetical protein
VCDHALQMKNMGNYASLYVQDWPGDEVLPETMITLPGTSNKAKASAKSAPIRTNFDMDNEENDDDVGPHGDSTGDNVVEVPVCGWNNLLVAVDKMHANKLMRQRFARLTTKPRVKRVPTPEVEKAMTIDAQRNSLGDDYDDDSYVVG